MKRAHRILLLLLIANTCLLLTACSSAWTSQAVNIIALLEPAIIAALGIVSAFGVGIPPTALTAIQAWGTEATNALTNVIKPLIDQYNAAEATAKPGILTEIDTALTVVINNLTTLLPTLHITDPATQAKVDAVIGAIASELTALLNLIPVVQGTVTSHLEVASRLSALKDAKAFKADFNAKAGVFGKQYEIK